MGRRFPPGRVVEAIVSIGEMEYRIMIVVRS